MKITIVVEHEDSDTCLVHETDSFEGAIKALTAFGSVLGHDVGTCPEHGEEYVVYCPVDGCLQPLSKEAA